MPALLITGANRGLGLGFVQQYLAAGWQIHAVARHADGALADLAKMNKALTLHALDVTDTRALAGLAAGLEDASLDLFINNAGIYGSDQQDYDNADAVAWTRTFAVNTIAPIHWAAALTPKVREGGTMAFLSSLMGSIADASGGLYQYRTSKAALNMAGRLLAADLAPLKIKVLLLHPGWVKTDMGGDQAPLEVTESVAGMIKVIAGFQQSASGTFHDYKGKTLPW